MDVWSFYATEIDLLLSFSLFSSVSPVSLSRTDVEGLGVDYPRGHLFAGGRTILHQFSGGTLNVKRLKLQKWVRYFFSQKWGYGVLHTPLLQALQITFMIFVLNFLRFPSYIFVSIRFY